MVKTGNECLTCPIATWCEAVTDFANGIKELSQVLFQGSQLSDNDDNLMRMILSGEIETNTDILDPAESALSIARPDIEIDELYTHYGSQDALRLHARSVYANKFQRYRNEGGQYSAHIVLADERLVVVGALKDLMATSCRGSVRTYRSFKTWGTTYQLCGAKIPSRMYACKSTITDMMNGFFAEMDTAELNEENFPGAEVAMRYGL